MNFEFSDDQEMLRATARKYLQEECDLGKARHILESQVSYDEEVWRGVANMGWIGAAVDEAYGGVGLGYLELCVIAEELGRALAPIPFASSVYLAIEALQLAGSESQRETWLPKLVRGEAIGTVAAAEGIGPLRTDNIEAVCAGNQLSGVKQPVLDGDVADLAVVLARQDGQSALFLVNLNDEGVSRHKLNTLDPTRSQARLEFSNAPTERLGGVGQGMELLERIYDRAAVLMAFEQLGCAQAALEMATEHAKQRFAFGRAIGSFQAIKHRLADMFVVAELARSNCYYGAWALSRNAPELPEAAAAARVGAIQANYQCTKENIQIHGGVGFTWEADCHLFYRRAKLQSLVLGGERVWKNRLISRLQAQHRQAQVPSRDRDAA